MKTLSLLLLLTLGLGAAWWKQAHPEGTIDEVRAEADTLVTRGKVAMDHGAAALGDARVWAVGALGLATGAATGASTDSPDGDGRVAATEDSTAPDDSAAPDTADDDATDGLTDEATDNITDGSTDGSSDSATDGATPDAGVPVADAPGEAAAAAVDTADVDAEADAGVEAGEDAVADAVADSDALNARMESLESQLAESAEAIAENARQQAEATAELQAEIQAEAAAPLADDVRAEVQAAIQAEMQAEVQAEVKAEVKAEVMAEVEAALKAAADDSLALSSASVAPALAAQDAIAIDGEDVDERITAATEGIVGEVASVEERLSDAEAQLAASAEREAETLDRLSMIDERLVSLADQLDSIGTGVNPGNATGSNIPSSTATDEDSDASVDTFAEEARETDATGGRPDALAASLDRRLALLESRDAAPPVDAARLDALIARVDALAAREQTATIDAEASVDAVQAAIRTALAELDARVGEDPSAGDAPAIGEALESTRVRLASLEARVQTMPASSDAAGSAKSAQDALQAQVRQLESRLETLSETDPDIVDSISAVRKQVDQLANSGFVTQDELRAQAQGRNVEYKIYFGVNSTSITDDAARVLDSFIAQEQNRTTGVSIFGFTDRRGPASYNQQLALERATNVRSYLIRNGLPYAKVRALSGLGEDAAAAVLPDDADDAQQRVVVIYAEQP